MAKRKAAAAPKTTSSKRTPNDDTVDVPTHSSSTFLDLPAELRTKILRVAAQDHGVGLFYRRTRGELSSRDAVSLVDKQLRKEFIDILSASASVVERLTSSASTTVIS